VISRKTWESLEVKDPAFVRASPVCAFAQPSDNRVIVFGGLSVNQFIFSSQDIVGKNVNVRGMRGTFREKPGFCNGSDTVIKVFNQKLYALDASAC
jgi:hypothetical protein